jgi:hypothetical protein
VEPVAVVPGPFCCVLLEVELGGLAGLVAFGFAEPELLVVVPGVAVVGVAVFGVVALVLGEPVCVVVFAGTQVTAPEFAGMPVCGLVSGVVALG